MGYISKFELEIINHKEIKNQEQLIDDLLNHTCLSDLKKDYLKLLTETGNINFEGKYYYLPNDLKLITRLHPELKITIEVIGEDRDDYRRIYVYQGAFNEIKAEVTIKYKNDKPLWEK